MLMDGFVNHLHFIGPIKILLLVYCFQNVINVKIRRKKIEANIYDGDVWEK